MYFCAMEALLERPEMNDPQNKFDTIKKTSLSQVNFYLKLMISFTKSIKAMQCNRTVESVILSIFISQSNPVKLIW